MIRADWVSDNDLAIKDGSKTVAEGRIAQSDGGWFIARAEATPTLDSAYGDFLVRLMIRRAYELGGYEQYVYATPDTAEFYKKLGFECDGVKMKHVGDVHGYC